MIPDKDPEIRRSFLACFLLIFSLRTTLGCEITFTNPTVTARKRIELNVTERTRPNSTIEVFRTGCKDDQRQALVKFYTQGANADLFYFDQNALKNKYSVNNRPGYRYSLIVVAVEIPSSKDSPVYLGIDVDITVVEGYGLTVPLAEEDLSVELFRGVTPGTIIWSIGKPNLTIAIGLPKVNKYVDDFEVTENRLSIATSRPLSRLPAKVDLPITLFSNNQDYLPLNKILTVELRPISEPVILGAVAVNISHADVCWRTPAHGVVQKFQLHMVSENVSVTSDVYPLEGQTEVCAKVHSLLLDMTYTFNVRAVYGSVQSPPSGTYFYTHTLKDPCLSNPCANNGVCLRLGEFSHLFNCTCLPGYTGSRCEQLDPCQGVTCQTGEVCTRLYDTAYLCACHGDSCGNACYPNPCQHGGSCIENKKVRRCVCPKQYGGLMCETPVSLNCENSTVVDVKGIFHWPETPYGQSRVLACPVSSGVTPEDRRWASRKCLLSPELKTHWLEQDENACPKAPLTEENVNAMISVIQSADTLSDNSATLEKITTVLEDIADTAAQSLQKAEQYIRAVDNVLKAETGRIQENNTNVRLIETFEKFLEKVSLTEGGSVKLDLINIKVDVREISDADTRDGVQYSSSEDSTGKSQVSSSISLPQEVFSRIRSSSYRVKFVLYSDSKLFPLDKTSNYTVERVLLAGVNNETVSDLQECVTFSLPKVSDKKAKGQYKCAFWDATEKRWSDAGVSKQGEDDRSVHCCSHHLTNFAVLLDVDPTVIISKFHTNVLSIMSYVGSGLSITGLTLTLITYSIFPCLHRSKSGQILLNLGSSMLCMHLLFIIGGDKVIVESQRACAAIAVLLHYSVISTLLWMGIEALNLYRLLVRVFAMYEKRFLIKRMVAGWGIPLLVVTLAISLDLSNYYTEGATSCQLSSRNIGVYYGTYISPVCLVLLGNLIVFVILLKVLLRPKFDNSLGKRTVTGAQIRGVMSVLVLLGISWILGVAAIGDAKLTFQYLFVITTSMQGFCIFIFRCLRNFEAQAAWRQLWYDGTIKTRRGAIIKTSGPTHTTSTLSTEEKSKSHRSLEKRPMSDTDESLQSHCKETDNFAVDISKLGEIGSEKGTFWLNKYRLIMGLEKGPMSANNNANLKL